MSVTTSKKRKPTNQTGEKVITPAELEGMMALISGDSATARRDRLMLLLLRYTGVRVNELVHLRRELITMELDRHPVIHVTVAKYGSNRDVPLRAILLDAIKAWLEVAPESDWLLCNTCARGGISTQRLERDAKSAMPGKSGRPAGSQMRKRNVQKKLAQLGKEAGVRGAVYPHRFRHTAITSWMIDDDLMVEDRALLAGHRNLQTTMRYTHAGDVQRVADKLALRDEAADTTQAPAPTTLGPASVAKQLGELHALHVAGALDAVEFAAAKAQVLGASSLVAAA